MKVLSMIQPWATFFAIGETKYETRSWSTKYRGKLAIHASKKTDKIICREEPFRSILIKHGYTEDTLPNGVIIATCRLTNCFKVTLNKGTSAILDGGQVVMGKDYLFGDYQEGYFAWEVDDMTLLTDPIPAKGKLSLWELEI
jgi:activating signal cointegrator 1